MKSILFVSVLATALALPQFVPATPDLPVAPATSSSPSTASAPAPTVVLDYGTFAGKSSKGINSFLGVPFAQQPIGNLRFRQPLPPLTLVGTQDATKYGPSCYQQSTASGLTGLGIAAISDQLVNNPLFAAANSSAEACLSLNVIGPVGAKGLPILVWIYGGGFEFGTTSGYDGTPIVTRSIANGEPVIYISMNYRLNGFGFLPGAEVKAAGVGNLGLADQREALRWVQKYATQFGGDPSKVTIWGESAGSISVSLQMVTPQYKTENLFRGAFMESGSPIASGPIDHPVHQLSYNRITEYVKCENATDTLQCLRTVPFESLVEAIDSTAAIFAYQSLNLVWRPLVDGIFLKIDPFVSVKNGDFAHVPQINGDCDDEGTLFAAIVSNDTTDASFEQYLQQQYAPTMNLSNPDPEFSAIIKAYPSTLSEGSPYNTSVLNALTPEFKRFSSFFGDIVFQASRRWYFATSAALQPTWSYIYRKNKAAPFLGSFHSSDLTTQFYANSIGSSDGQYQAIDYLLNFVNHLNPNNPKATNLINWPQYTVASPQLMTYFDPPTMAPGTPSLTAPGLMITLDDFRIEAMKAMNVFSLKYVSNL